MYTFLSLDGTTYLSDRAINSCDIAIPDNIYGIHGKFDRSSMSWVIDPTYLKEQINTSVATEIISGFEYTVNNTLYKFKYDLVDQQNLSDIANTILLNDLKASSNTMYIYGYIDGIKTKIDITYKEFIDLYKYAVSTKLDILEKGNEEKCELELQT